MSGWCEHGTGAISKSITHKHVPVPQNKTSTIYFFHTYHALKSTNAEVLSPLSSAVTSRYRMCTYRATRVCTSHRPWCDRTPPFNRSSQLLVAAPPLFSAISPPPGSCSSLSFLLLSFIVQFADWLCDPWQLWPGPNFRVQATGGDFWLDFGSLRVWSFSSMFIAMAFMCGQFSVALRLRSLRSRLEVNEWWGCVLCRFVVFWILDWLGFVVSFVWWIWCVNNSTAR